MRSNGTALGLVPSAARGLARVPFTATLWAAVALVGLATGTWRHAIAPETLARWGTGPEQLAHGRWWTLVADTAFSHGPWMYWGLLLFLIPASVGLYEWLAGTRRALPVYWATDLGGSLLVDLGVILPLFHLGGGFGRELAELHDVGMSGGGFGCAGALVNRLPPPRRRAAILLAAAYLLVRLGTLTEFRADLLHLVAFFAGLALDRRLDRPQPA